MDELKDVQVKVLTEADIYRESGGATEEDMDRTGQSMPNPSGGPTPNGSMPNPSQF